MADRVRKGGRVLLAAERGEILGMLELRKLNHIAMLFVGDKGRGTGRALVERCIQLFRNETEDLDQVSVHASRYAVPIYEKLGFEAAGPVQTENGITYVPMVISSKRAVEAASSRPEVAHGADQGKRARDGTPECARQPAARIVGR